MLVYEAEGFLEVEAKDIRQLSRSSGTVRVTGGADEYFDVQAVLCDFLDKAQPRCRAVFFAKDLKRALVFSASHFDNSAWISAQKFLDKLGFHLEPINLNLSPAMLEVVLRDVPGLVAPSVARKQRREKNDMLAALQREIDKDPESSAGMKAALKLSSEKRLGERMVQLRGLLDELFTREEHEAEVEAFNTQLEDLKSKVDNLSVRLQEAESSAEDERKQRQLSESITAAAEKRIQELEAVLVDVETKSAGELKQKRRLDKLQKQVKQLETQLESALAEARAERVKQDQLITDAASAHEQINHLEASLQKAKESLAETNGQLVAAQAELNRATNELSARIVELEKELKGSESQLKKLADAETAVEELNARLSSVELENRNLAEQLMQAEKLVRESQASDRSVQDLESGLDRLAAELQELKIEYERECGIRKRLEKHLAERDHNIQSLEESLAVARSAAAIPATGSSGEAEQLESLRSELHEYQRQADEEQTIREELEGELEQTRKMIDSLEKMVRETTNGAGKRPAAKTIASAEAQKMSALEAQLEAAQNQLDESRKQQEELAKALAGAERQLAEQDRLVQGGLQAEAIAPAGMPEAAVEFTAPKPSKPLPHEVRPAPEKGAFFQPDWDLEGLPCASVEQVFKVWETVFNVQIALAGYPSQYCMAFLVVLQVNEVKKLYLLFRLKQNKHTLIMVPAKSPKSEIELKKAIDEGLKFLKKSGFEMELMPEEYRESSLSGFFLER